MPSQIDNLESIVQLQKTIDSCIQLQNALMYPTREHKPIGELIEDASSNCFITSKELDKKAKEALDSDKQG